MNIFAVVKKAINSDLNKPLNITLDEIKNSLSSVPSENKKVVRKVAKVRGIPYNEIYESQVLSLDDEPVLSVKGSGRVLQIFPVFSRNISANKYGTALVTVDDNIIVNNEVRYITTQSGFNGYPLVDCVNTHVGGKFTSDIFGEIKNFFITLSEESIGDSQAFSTKFLSIINPLGIPFKNGFDIRLSQFASETPEDVGVIVVYELYE